MIQEGNVIRMPRRKDAYFQQVKCACGCKTFTAEVFPITPGEPGTEDEGEPNVNARVIGVVCSACKKTIFYNGC